MEKCKEINLWKADIAIESHFNSSASESSNGCETIYFSLPSLNNIKYSQNGKMLAESIQKYMLIFVNSYEEDMTNRFMLKDRGIKGMGDIRRIYNGKETIPRFTFLTKTNMPAVISEPLFLSNKSDCSFLLSNRKLAIRKIAEGVVDGILDYSSRIRSQNLALS
jgi:N-acetylmuramoyl-L-alanine amidase